MKILLIDNYDSFTYNLVHLIEQFDGVEVAVHRNDEFTPENALQYDKILLSPGPGLPGEAGILKQVIRETAGKRSILGVCLGMQAIGEVFGATLFNLHKVRHGIATTTSISDPSEILFKGLPSRLKTGSYHSWMVSKENLPASIRITSEDEAGHIMSLRHEKFDVCGVQFHPESVLTEFGKEIMWNWISGNSTGI